MQIIGLHKNEVKLVPHNPGWDDLFNVEKEKFLSTIGSDILVEHIGSTAIPTICAKPVVGIMIGYKNINDIQNIISNLKKINYIFQKNESPTEPILFIKTNKTKSLFHLHVTKYNSLQWKYAIGFRDYLNNNLKVAKEYEALKIELAKKFQNDRLAYKKGKEKFILDIYKKII